MGFFGWVSSYHLYSLPTGKTLIIYKLKVMLGRVRTSVPFLNNWIVLKGRKKKVSLDFFFYLEYESEGNSWQCSWAATNL